MPHSLFICQHYYPEEVSTGLHITELTTKITQLHKEHQISVLCATPSKEGPKSSKINTNEIHRNIKIYRVSNWGKQHGSIFTRSVFAIGFFLKAFTFILKHHRNFDNIVITTNPPFLGIIPLLLKRIIKKPYVLIVYDIYPDIAIKLNIIKPKSLVSKLWRWINIKVYNSAKSIVVIGEDMRRIVCESMEVKNIQCVQLIHNWSDKNVIYPVKIEDNRFLNKYSFQRKIILMYSGTFGRTHNIEQILDAAEDLRNHEDIVFLFIGSGNKKRVIEQRILSRGLSNLILLPYQPLDMLADTQSAATISFVCLEDEFTGLSVPSKTYGIMAAGVPTIALLRSDSEIAQTVLTHKCGRVWHKDVKLSQLILDMLDNSDNLKRMGQNARIAFLENFELEISANKYHKLIMNSLFNNKNLSN